MKLVASQDGLAVNNHNQQTQH